MCFPPNLSSCIIRFQFRIVDFNNFRFYFGFLSLRAQTFLSNSLINFSTSLDPNRVIFYSVDLSLSSLSKSINFPSLSPQFIIRFDRISKDLSKIPYFSMDSTLIHHYTS